MVREVVPMSEKGGEMQNHGLPAAAVLDDMCRVCGDHEMEKHEGHKFRAFPRPQLPIDVDVAFQRTTWLEDGALRARVRGWVAGSDEKFAASVWLWSTAQDDKGSEPEWNVLEDAVRVQLARLLCPHVDHQAYAGMARLTEEDASVALPPAIGYHLDVRVWCTDCGEPFVFVGDDLQVGMRPDMPTVDVFGTTLAAPMRPRSTPEGWGRDRPGYVARVRR